MLPQWLQLGLVALLAAGLYTMAALLVSLWAVSLDVSPSGVGVVAASGSVAPLLLAVPVGAAAGQLGTRRLLAVAAVLAVVAALATPLARDRDSLVAVQLLGGLGRAMAWMMAQVHLVQLGGGPAGARRAVTFSFAAMLGTLLGPLLVGVVVHVAGYEATFLTVAGAYGLLAAVAAGLPAAPVGRYPRRGVSPRLAFHAALSLALGSGIGLVLLGTFLRFASGSLRLSFFPLYLHELGLSPLPIGLLVGFGNLVLLGAVFAAGPLLARCGPLRLLYLALLLALGALAATPMATSLLLLASCSALWGVGMGLSLPALLQEIAEDAVPRDRGVVMGLRQMVNEAAALVSPLALGLASARIGLDGGFYLVGG